VKLLINRLKEKGYKISAAESCTGGLISKLLTDVSGASEVFDCAVTTYSNEAKIALLGVKPETLEKHTAISEETACEMAQGVLNLSGSDIAVSVTGLAGPNSDDSGKPVGTVCIGIATAEKCYAKTFLFAGSRSEIRKSSAKMACTLVFDELGISPKKDPITKTAVSKVKTVAKKIRRK